MLYEILLVLISIIHAILLLLALVIPFSSNNLCIMMYVLFVPFVVFHWLLNNNMCSLTLLEKYIRTKLGNDKIENVDCFTCRLIHPVYDFVNNYNNFSNLIYTTAFLLWSLCVYKLYKKIKSNEITKLEDFFNRK